jgi:hypothetical protein
MSGQATLERPIVDLRNLVMLGLITRLYACSGRGHSRLSCSSLSEAHSLAVGILFYLYSLATENRG